MNPRDKIMSPSTQITGFALYAPFDNIDTDLIIPAQHITSIEKDGYLKGVFEQLGFVRQKIVGDVNAKNEYVMISQSNFGCGSSREQAIWALKEAKVTAVIASSFAEIFSNNAARNQFPLICVENNDISALLLPGNSEQFISIDLEKSLISTSHGLNITFQMNAYVKRCLLGDINHIDYILANI